MKSRTLKIKSTEKYLNNNYLPLRLILEDVEIDDHKTELEFISTDDIKNKLSPIVNLLALIENNVDRKS